MNLLKTNGRFSLTKILTTIGYGVFILLSLYMALTGKTWDHYGEFAAASGGAILVRVADKWLNTKQVENEK